MSSKSILNKKSMLFLEQYLNNASPTGYEWEGQKIWMNYLKPYADEFIADTYGSAVAVINPEHKYKVVIEGHSDEISWYVNYISDKGLISVIRNGGSDHQIAPSKIVNIHTEKGIVKGVFGWPAIHTRLASKEEPPKLDNIFIDVGCKTKKEVDTSNFFEILHSDSKNIIYPKINFETNTMNGLLFTNKTKFETNKYDIQEPSDNIIFNPKMIELVFIPLLSFDIEGNRVGYGSGFYDRFLKECKSDILKIGLSFFEPEIKIEDTNSSDVKLNFCITPQKIFSF